MPFAPFRMGSLLVGQGRSGVGIGVGVCNFRPESDSESLKFVDSTALLLTIQFHFHFLIKGEGMAYCPPPWLRPCRFPGCVPTLRITGGPAACLSAHIAYRTPSQRPAGRLLHMPVPPARRFTGGGPAGRPRRMTVPTLHQPCRLQVGSQAAFARGCNAMPPLFLVGGPAGRSCPWLSRNATTLSRRLDRRPPPARGCTARHHYFS